MQADDLPLTEPERLANRLKQRCGDSYQPIFAKRRKSTCPITTNDQYGLMFCPMCKLASTYWTRFFHMLDHYGRDVIKSPYDVPINEAPPTNERMTVTLGSHETSLDGYYKFLFVRDPYSRLLSAYVDKVFAPNPTFWRIFHKLGMKYLKKSRVAVKCGSDITFSDYIRIVVQAHRTNPISGSADCHDATYMFSCHPCEVQYDFVGKMESFSRDSMLLFEKLHLNKTIEALRKEGKQLADEDALMDTVTSPFKWRKSITACIPWHEALGRVWKKLQIRGVIGRQDMPLSEQEADSISQEAFVRLIKHIQSQSTPAQRREQRKQALVEIYSTVDPAYLKDLKVLYRKDFEFFEYDKDNPNIFPSSRNNSDNSGYFIL